MTTHPNGPLSVSDREKIISMWKAGRPATVIGAEIGRSRNSVLGFAHRNRGLCPPRDGVVKKRRLTPSSGTRKRKPSHLKSLECDSSAPRSDVDEILLYQANRGEQARSSETPDRKRVRFHKNARPHYPLKDGLPLDANPVAFMDVKPNQCRWPVNNSNSTAAGAEMMVCGAPVMNPNSRYGMARTHCVCHMKMAGQCVEKVERELA